MSPLYLKDTKKKESKAKSPENSINSGTLITPASPSSNHLFPLTGNKKINMYSSCTLTRKKTYFFSYLYFIIETSLKKKNSTIPKH